MEAAARIDQRLRADRISRPAWHGDAATRGTVASAGDLLGRETATAAPVSVEVHHAVDSIEQARFCIVANRRWWTCLPTHEKGHPHQTDVPETPSFPLAPRPTAPIPQLRNALPWLRLVNELAPYTAA